MSHRNVLYAVIILLITGLVGFGKPIVSFLARQDAHSNHSAATTTATLTTKPEPTADGDYIGTIATSTDGTFFVYTSTKYKLRFTYPKGWIVGDNRLGYGTLQLFAGGNKIEAWIISREHMTGFLEGFEETQTLRLHNIVWVREESIAGDGMLIDSYYTNLPSEPSFSFVITIYGQSNTRFYVLNDLVRSVEWLN